MDFVFFKLGILARLFKLISGIHFLADAQRFADLRSRISASWVVCGEDNVSLQNSNFQLPKPEIA
ncbi:MAG TPA: hypothetical protein VFR70_07015 [Flavobacterium sp.]|nr:hypothetical protein [Flavobacterium sp.]